MATVDEYKIKIDVAGGAAIKEAQANIQGLENTIGGLTGALSNLATAGFAALSALGVSALKMADDMADLSAATGISVGAIYNLSNALEQSGGSFDGGSMMIGKFAKALDEAVGGSDKAQQAFAKLGISTQELATMTDEQLFQAAIDGLAGMEDGFAKTALATQIFGKEAKNIDFDSIAEGTRNAVDPELEQALLRGAQFVDDMSAAFRFFQETALKAMAPVLESISVFLSNTENVKTTVKVLGALLAAAFAASVVGAIISTVNAMIKLGAAIRAAAVGQAFLTGLTGLKGLAVIAAAAAAAAVAYNKLGEAMDKAGKSGAAVPTPKGGDTPAPGTQLRDVQTSGSSRARASAQSSAEATAKAMKQQAEAAKETTRQLIMSNEESNKMRELEISLIGISSERANLIKSNAQAQSNAAKDIAKLEADINEERAKGTKANQAVIIELQKQIVEKQKQVKETERLNQLEYDRTLELAKQNNLLQYQNQFEQDMADETYNTLQENVRLQILKGNLSTKEAEALLRGAKLRLDYEKKIIDLQNQIVEAGDDEAKVNALELRMKLEKNRYEAAIENATNEAKFNENLQKSTLAGIRDVIEKQKEQFSEYNIAVQTTTSIFNNMYNALDNFVTTGKLKFGDLARSIIADMAKIALKAAASNILGAIFGGLFKFPSINALTPFKASTAPLGPPLKFVAAGGPAKQDMPHIVGEQGPELFVPNSAGRIITNASLNKNTSAPAAQVQPVVNNTYITNNISAIDSRSVAQMFVENRKSLLGASMMARKEMPYGS